MKTFPALFLFLLAAAPLGAPVAEGAGPEPAPPTPAATPPAAVPQAAPSRLLTYVPEDADLAVIARVDLLMRTERGRKIVALSQRLIAAACGSFPRAIDLEKNVAALACVDQSNMLENYWSQQRQRVA